FRAGFELRLEPLQEADVLVPDEDVHEPAERAVVVAQTLAHPRELPLEVFDQLADVRSVRTDVRLAARHLAERRWDLHRNAHEPLPSEMRSSCVRNSSR